MKSSGGDYTGEESKKNKNAYYVSYIINNINGSLLLAPTHSALLLIQISNMYTFFPRIPLKHIECGIGDWWGVAVTCNEHFSRHWFIINYIFFLNNMISNFSEFNISNKNILTSRTATAKNDRNMNMDSENSW